ncbi:MAG: hypothetical protein DRQ56_10570, partial [Gammaproteobacteria bacterium]
MKQVEKILAALALSSVLSISGADTVFVTLEKDNALAVVDGTTGKLVKTVDLGQRPRGIILSADGSQLYIAASDDDTIQIVDSTTYEIVGALPSGDDPETFDMSPDGKRLFVSNEDDDLVTVIDTVSQSVVKEIAVGVEPEGIAASPDGKWVVNSSETTNMIHWIDTGSLEIVENTLVDQRPRAVKFTADSQQLWVTSEVGGVLSILDAQTQQPIKKLTFKIRGVTAEQIQPVGIAIDKAGQWGYVALGPANRVAVIDVRRLEVVDYLLVGQRVWNLAFSPDQSRLYTTNGVSNDISI